MRSFLFIAVILFISCETTNDSIESQTTNDSLEVEKLFNEDSVYYWVSTDYLENLADTFSICDCWRKTQFHLLEIDTIEMNLHIQSNLFHFGMDSEADFALLRDDISFRSDTSHENFINDIISFEYPFSRSLVLKVGDKVYKFAQNAYPKIKNDEGQYYTRWDLWDQSAIMNSTALLKYDKIDSINSTQHFFSVDSLESMITSGKIRSGCSDDYNYNHMSYKNEDGELIHFHLQFFKEELRVYKVPGRDRHVEVELDSNEMQILINSSY